MALAPPPGEPPLAPRRAYPIVFDEIINALVTPLPADRAATLATFDERIAAAATVRNLLAAWREPVERLARADMKALQPRLAPELFPIVGRARAMAIELRQAFDNGAVPIDLILARRAAVSARMDSEFTTACQVLEREVARYVSATSALAARAEVLHRALAELQAAPTLCSDSFNVAPLAEAGGFSTKQFTSSPAAPVAVAE